MTEAPILTLDEIEDLAQRALVAVGTSSRQSMAIRLSTSDSAVAVSSVNSPRSRRRAHH